MPRSKDSGERGESRTSLVATAPGPSSPGAVAAFPEEIPLDLWNNLTSREQAFIRHPEVMTNCAKAARDVGYSPSFCASGKAAAKRRQLMFYIRPINHARLRREGITLDGVHEELACIAFANPADYYQRIEVEETNGQINEILTGLDPALLPEKMARAVAHITTENITLPNGDILQLVGYDLHDKKVALKMLAEMLGGFDPTNRQPGDAAERKRQSELFEYMTQDDIDTIVRIYRRAEDKQKAAAMDAEIIEGKKK